MGVRPQYHVPGTHDFVFQVDVRVSQEQGFACKTDMTRYECVLFDWDGCLAQTLGIWVDALRDLLQERGIPLSDQEIVERMLGDWDSPRKVGVQDPDAFLQKLLAITSAKLPGVGLYDGARDMLDSLQRREKKLAVLTTSRRVDIMTVMKNVRLENMFDLVLTAEDVTNHKPHPEQIEVALQQLGFTTKQALMVGDSHKDLESALRSGVDSVLFYPELHKNYYRLSMLQSFRPNYTIRALPELLPIIG